MVFSCYHPWTMRIFLILVVLALPFVAAAGEVTFEADDGVQIFADFYKSEAGQSAPVVLMLHQARSNGRGEYATIAPELSARGVNLLVVDLRAGGDAFDSVNRTVAGLDGATYGYCDVPPDIAAAAAFMRSKGFDGPLLVWGSSYSAALAIRYAAEHADDVAGYLAFSPASGEPMAGCQPEDGAENAKAGIVFRPESEMELKHVAAQLEILKGKGAKTVVVPNGVHGSSMLVDERTEHDMSAYREQAYTFLHSVASQGTD